MTGHDEQVDSPYVLMSTPALLDLRRGYRRMSAALDGVTPRHERQVTYRRLQAIERELILRGVKVDDSPASMHVPPRQNGSR